jgi:hypothetical protein
MLRELPDHLAASVIRASGVTLHECMIALPPHQHAIALEALSDGLTTHRKLHIAGRETAELHAAISNNSNETGTHGCCEECEGVCTPVDTIAVACSAASAFSGIKVWTFDSMHVR